MDMEIKPVFFTETFTGKKFSFIDVPSEAIDIVDIAHSLSMMCRFNGHVRVFYNIADHSIRVSKKVSSKYRLQALLHDASEAYIADLIRPVKNMVIGYNEIEDRIMKAISLKYGFDWPMSDEVMDADNRILMSEKRDLLPATDWDWGCYYIPYPEKIVPLSQKSSEKAFLKRFHEILS